MKKFMLALVIASLAVTGAFAHPQFKAAGPVPGSTVTAPKTVRIKFSEAIELALSGIEIKNKAGEVQATGMPSIDPKDKTVLVVPVTAALAAGEYTVNWHAVGDDTHHQEGHYSFTVKS